MMDKVAFYPGEDEFGAHAIPLFGAADDYFEKVAAPLLLDPVVRYISSLRPRDDAQYVLTNAMGASEFYGSNVNGDYFPEESLIHAPDKWTGTPVIDRITAQDWPYGYPTFYSAYPFAHHRNKDASRAYGEVELAVWNDRMKRVELVIRVDLDKCKSFGGMPVWDRLKAGQYPDVSMGCRVPWDLCSICGDVKLYKEALATFDPKKHKHPGIAVLEFHKRLKERNGVGIRGLAITRKDYCQHALKQMNKILPDGRKVYVINYFPRFFDISFVFVGADKTAKVMLKLAEDKKVFWFLPGAELAEKLGYQTFEAPSGLITLEKNASVADEIIKMSFLGKRAKDKRAEIEKSITSQLTEQAIPVITRHEPDLPADLIDELGKHPLEDVLSTSSGMGIVLKPREFQRLILIKINRKDLADDYDRKGEVFPKSKETDKVPLGPEFFSQLVAKLLTPFFEGRSALAPAIEGRLLHPDEVKEKKASASSHPSDVLRKIGSAYNGYRDQVMELLAHAQPLAQTLPGEACLQKVASSPLTEVFTEASVAYVKQAYWDEVTSV